MTDKMIDAVEVDTKEVAFHEGYNKMIDSLDSKHWDIEKVRDGLFKSGIPMCIFHSLYEAGYEAALRAVREFERHPPKKKKNRYNTAENCPKCGWREMNCRECAEYFASRMRPPQEGK
jgi:hypothetical protein